MPPGRRHDLGLLAQCRGRGEHALHPHLERNRLRVRGDLRRARAGGQHDAVDLHWGDRIGPGQQIWLYYGQNAL